MMEARTYRVRNHLCEFLEAQFTIPIVIALHYSLVDDLLQLLVLLHHVNIIGIDNYKTPAGKYRLSGYCQPSSSVLETILHLI